MPYSYIPDAINEFNKNTPYVPLSKFTIDLDLWILFSLYLQFMLVILGQNKRRMKSSGYQYFTTAYYLYAITVANYAMGSVPDNNARGGRTGELRVFWAPSLILHLGGPSSITVLSVSDNELWLRYALHLITLSYTFGRVSVHNYFLKNDLWVATLLVFFAGAVKYSERIICLFLARLTKFRGSTLPDPDPGVNYARLMLTYSSFRQSNIPAEFRLTTITGAAAVAEAESGDNKLTQLQIVQEAFRLFRAFQGLFVNMAYSYSSREKSRRLFLKLDVEQAFDICRAELKLAYDVFYTKLLLLRSTIVWAVLINLFVFFLQLASLVLWIRVDKSQFQPYSTIVTHALVYGSIALDLISIYTLFTSDWVVARIGRPRTTGFLLASLQKLLLLLNSQRSLLCSRKSSEFISQVNLIDPKLVFSTPKRSLLYILPRFPILRVMLPDELQNFLFHELQTRSNLAQQPRDVAEICNSRGMWALTLLSGKYESKGINLANAFAPWISGVDYEESLVLWHLATTLCYAPDSDVGDHHLSKIMSNYMFYLLIVDPKMMPPSAKFLGKIIFRDTKAELDRFSLRIPLPHKSSVDWVKEASTKIIQVNTDMISPNEVRGQDSRSALFDASVLAKKLQGLQEMGINKWEVINKVWAEMLFYAAAHCSSSIHVEKLTEGSQLLTTVWLLMAHLGLGKHFRHNKAKDRRAHLLITKHA